MRSESRTEETSGFTTTTARSAKYMARCAPFSIPAGESQMMYSKPSAPSSSSTPFTPSEVSASLSRVCEAASTNSVSKRLSLISACFSVQSPWITFTKSYTTRRSHPMMRSRLRRPMSKSMTATFLPRLASPHARLAEVVVLPTPPLPEVTTMISVNALALPSLSRADPREVQVIAREPCLHGLTLELRWNRLEHPEHAGDRHQLRMKRVAEHACAHFAARPGNGAPAQRP